MGSLALAAGLRAMDALTKNQTKYIASLILFLAAIYFICSYSMVLSFQFPAGYNRPTLNLITSYTYGILQSLAVVSLFNASMRTLNISEFLLWSFFLTLNGSDFALRYQDVGKQPLGTPVFEFGWAVAIAMLSCTVLWQYINRIE